MRQQGTGTSIQFVPESSLPTITAGRLDLRGATQRLILLTETIKFGGEGKSSSR